MILHIKINIKIACIKLILFKIGTQLNNTVPPLLDTGNICYTKEITQEMLDETTQLLKSGIGYYIIKRMISYKYNINEEYVFDVIILRMCKK